MAEYTLTHTGEEVDAAVEGWQTAQAQADATASGITETKKANISPGLGTGASEGGGARPPGGTIDGRFRIKGELPALGDVARRLGNDRVLRRSRVIFSRAGRSREEADQQRGGKEVSENGPKAEGEYRHSAAHLRRFSRSRQRRRERSAFPPKFSLQLPGRRIKYNAFPVGIFIPPILP